MPVINATWKTIGRAIERAAKLIRNRPGSDYRNTSVDEIVDQFIYRGQSDATWRLETTLERNVSRRVSIDEYESFACEIEKRMKGVASKTPKSKKKRHWFDNNAYRLEKEQGLLNQTLLSHLRHYGLPSPLLDWSSSHYVAAFFAFSEMSEASKSAAIYLHLPQLKRKSDSLFKAAPGIHRLKPGYNPNQRHFDQKCVHTLSLELIEDKESFVTHEEAACGSFVAKIEIKSEERDSVMKDLRKMGISRFKLYGGDDSLVKDLWDEKKARLIQS